MPIWADAVAVLMALTGLASILTAVRTAWRRPEPYGGQAAFRGLSIGDQAEHWLRSRRLSED